MPISSLPIAVAQSPMERDVAANGERIRAQMDQAHERGARMVHFTEGALSGYVKAQIDDWADVDWDAVDGELARIRAHARNRGLFVVLGANRRGVGDERPFNTLHVISDGGAVVARYDKRYCSHSELTDWYQPGSAPCVFEVDGFRFGCCLCIEVHFPTLFAEYERLDVDCVLLSAYSRDPIFWTEARGHAACHNLWVSVATPSACGDALPTGLIGPHGYELARAPAEARPHLLSATLDRDDPDLQVALTQARPWRRKVRRAAETPSRCGPG